jgi:hypothetical protein
MSIMVPGFAVVESTRDLAHSALPDAPVEPDEPDRIRPVRRLTGWLGALVRRARPATRVTTDPSAVPSVGTVASD